jgi:hypothetical protein
MKYGYLALASICLFTARVYSQNVGWWGPKGQYYSGGATQTNQPTVASCAAQNKLLMCATPKSCSCVSKPADSDPEDGN